MKSYLYLRGKRAVTGDFTTSIIYGDSISLVILPSFAKSRVADIDSVASIYPFSRVKTATSFSEQSVGSLDSP